MAVIRDISEAEQEWIDSRPESVKALIKVLPPNRLYRIKACGCRCEIYSYGELGTVTVKVTGKWNMVEFNHLVSPLTVDDLEECELPGPDEPVGERLGHLSND